MIKRLASLLLLLMLIFAASRAMIRALPGDPIETLIAETGTLLPRERLAHELGLDRPFFSAMIEDFRRALGGDLGHSLLSKLPVGPTLLNALAHSFALTTSALVIGLMASLILGLGSAQTQAPRVAVKINQLTTLHGALAAALPTPWLGPILLYALAVRLPLFPISKHLALPAITLAIGISGFWGRLIRERVKDTLRTGAAPGARARGLPEWKVLLKYGLIPCSGPLIAYLGTQAGSLLAGTFVIEVIFGWPGLGSLLVDAVLKRDYPVVEAAVFLGAAASLLGTAAGDLCQHWIDPRGRSV